MTPVDDGAILAWEDPPKVSGPATSLRFTGADVAAILEPLRARPGRWALVLDATSAPCERLAKLLQAAGAEATTRRNRTTKPVAAKCYARWPGARQS